MTSNQSPGQDAGGRGIPAKPAENRAFGHVEKGHAAQAGAVGAGAASRAAGQDREIGVRSDQRCGRGGGREARGEPVAAVHRPPQCGRLCCTAASPQSSRDPEGWSPSIFWTEGSAFRELNCEFAQDPGFTSSPSYNLWF